MHRILALILSLLFSFSPMAAEVQSNKIYSHYAGLKANALPIIFKDTYGEIDYSDVHHALGIFHGFWISDSVGIEYSFSQYSPKDRYKYYGDNSFYPGNTFHILTSEYSISSFDVGVFLNLLNSQDTSLIGLLGISRTSIKSKYELIKHNVYGLPNDSWDVFKEKSKNSIKTSQILPHFMISIDQMISSELVIRASIDWKKFSSFHGKNYFFHDHHIDIRIMDSIGCGASIMFRF